MARICALVFCALGAATLAALRECREAQRALDQANTVLSPADRTLLKSIPADF